MMLTEPHQLNDLTDTDLISALRDHHLRFTRHKANFLTMLGEFLARELARPQGASSPATWLMRELDCSRSTAFEYLSVAKRLRNHDQLSRLFLEGVLGYSKVRLLLRYLDGDNEAELIQLARTLGYIELEAELSGRPRTGSSGENAKEYFKITHDDDTGGVRFWGRLGPDRAAEFKAALKIAELVALRDISDLPDETGKPTDQLTLEELDELIDRAGQADELAPSQRVEPPGDIEATSDAARSEKEGPESSRKGHRFGPPLRSALLQSLFMVVSMVRTNPRSAVRAPGAEVHLRVELDRHPRILGQVGAEIRYFYRMLMNAHTQVELIDERGVQISLGRRKRAVSTTQARILLAQWQGQCALPGCVHVHFLEFHHIVAWADLGKTDLDNLIPLCQACHALVTAGVIGIGISPQDPAMIEFSFPDSSRYISARRGAPIPAQPVLPPAAEPIIDGEVIEGDSFDDSSLP